jgi:hypothetical protein
MELSRNAPRASAIPAVPNSGVSKRAGDTAIAIQKAAITSSIRKQKDPESFVKDSFGAILGKEVERLQTFVAQTKDVLSVEKDIQLQVQVYLTIVQTEAEFVLSLPSQDAKTRYALDAEEWAEATQARYQVAYAEGSYLKARTWETQQDFEVWVEATTAQMEIARVYTTSYDEALVEMLEEAQTEINHRAKASRSRKCDQEAKEASSKSRRTGESWETSRRRAREAEERTDKRHQNATSSATRHAREKRKTRSRSPTPPRRREYHSRRNENVADMNDPTLSMPDRARAANKVFEAIPKETRKDAMLSLPKTSLKTEHAVQNFVKAMDREITINPDLDHVWFLLARGRLEQDIQSSLLQHFGDLPLPCSPWPQAKKYLLRTFASEDNYFSLIEKLSVTCSFNDDPTIRKTEVAAFSARVSLARTELMHRYPGLVNDLFMLELFRKWMGQSTWLSSEFSKLYDATQLPSWEAIEAVLVKLVSRVAMGSTRTARSREASLERTQQLRTVQAQVNTLQQLMQQQQPQVHVMSTGGGAAQPTASLPGPPPSRTCSFCKHRGVPNENQHQTYECQFLNSPDPGPYTEAKNAWRAQLPKKYPGANPQQNRQYETQKGNQGAQGLGFQAS